MSSQEKLQDFDIPIPAKRIKISDESEILAQKYEMLHEHYTKDGLSQQIQLFLRRIASSPEVPSEWRHIPLLRMLSETCKEFLFNELEISMWSIFLEKVVWNNHSLPLHWLLLYSAYAAKRYLNEDMHIFECFVLKKYENFMHSYQNWLMTNQDLIKVSPKKLNSKYLALSTPPTLLESEIIDYNYYVDDILQIAPPSNANEKEVKIEVASINVEPDDPKLPELLNLNSVLKDAAEMPDQFSGKAVNNYDLFQPSMGNEIDNLPFLLPNLSRIPSNIKEEDI